MQRSPGNIIFASCRRRSCAKRFLVGLADISQSCQQNLPYFFRVFTKRFSTLAVYRDKAYSICDKQSQNDGWRTRCARAASYFIDHGSHFPYILLVSRGHTPFRKRGRGKGSGNFRCSRLLHRNLFTPHCASANAA